MGRLLQGDGPLIPLAGPYPDFEVSIRTAHVDHAPFVVDSSYLYSDTVFAGKSSTDPRIPQVDDPVQARGWGLPIPFRTVDFAVTTSRCGTKTD